MITPGFSLNVLNNKRAGVIVYTVHNNELYFLLGIDRRTREFTDFGGGCKQTETLVESAWREFIEETCGIFNNHLTIKDLECSVAVTNSVRDTAIFFVYVPDKWISHAESKFNSNLIDDEIQMNCNAIQRNTNVFLENINVKWVKDSDFYNIAFNKKSQCMWGRVQKFLMNNVNYTELKLCLIIKLMCGI